MWSSTSAHMLRARLALALAAPVAFASCATLEQIGQAVSAPRFSRIEERRPELRLVSPSSTSPSGGAVIRLWVNVTNPNPFSVTLSQLSGTLSLDDARAATADFPLGVPLRAGGDAEIPLDLSVDFGEWPGVARALRRAASSGEVGYRFDGSVGVDTPLGRPTFGPMTIVDGTLDLRDVAGLLPRTLGD